MTEYSARERILGEIKSDNAWMAFCIYRDMPSPRSMTEAENLYREQKGRQRAKNSSSHFGKWRRAHFWDDRIAAEESKLARSAIEKIADRATDEVYAAIEEDCRIVAQLNKGGRANNIQSAQISQKLTKLLLDCEIKKFKDKAEFDEHMQQLHWQTSQVKIIAGALREVRSCDKATFEIEGLIMASNDRIYAVSEMLTRFEEHIDRAGQ